MEVGYKLTALHLIYLEYAIVLSSSSFVKNYSKENACGVVGVETVPTSTLVPGDVIEIGPKTGVMQCDAILITGTCVINESMLTGNHHLLHLSVMSGLMLITDW